MLPPRYQGFIAGALLNCVVFYVVFIASNKIDEKTVIFRPSRKATIRNILLDHKRQSLDKLKDLIGRNASSRDLDVISLARDLMDPPSDHMVKVVRSVVSTPQSEQVVQLLQNKRNGFFVESGALDGERSSNTIHLEQKYEWSGLLVEMDPYYYTQLRGKSRRAWSINACVSPVDRPIIMNFKEDSGGKGTLRQKTELDESAVPCFPIETLLLALNTTHVDYWSLDVEGFELPILRTVPFDRLDITMLSVEYVHGKDGKEAYRTFMEENGYRVEKDISMSNHAITLYVNDYIFVKNK